MRKVTTKIKELRYLLMFNVTVTLLMFNELRSSYISYVKKYVRVKSTRYHYIYYNNNNILFY